MILTVEEVRDLCPGMTDEVIQMHLGAIEGVIRAYTNNPFQVREARFTAPSSGSFLSGASPYIKAGDTIQISESGINDGLYVVVNATEYDTEVEGDLFDWPSNLVTLIRYPAEVKAVARNLLKWEATGRDKTGVKSETLSRHSVTYYDQQNSNSFVMGYPASIVGALLPYRKARF